MKIIETHPFKTAQATPSPATSRNQSPICISPDRIDRFVRKYKLKAVSALNELFGMQFQKQYGGLLGGLKNWWSNNFGFNRKQKKVPLTPVQDQQMGVAASNEQAIKLASVNALPLILTQDMVSSFESIYGPRSTRTVLAELGVS